MISGSIYVCGGTNSPHRLCYQWTPPAGPWQRKADLLESAEAATGTVGPDGKFYLIGCGDDIRQVQRFDPGVSPDGEWSLLPPLNILRFWPAVATAGGMIYVFGGMAENESSPNSWLQSIERYRPGDNQWELLDDPPQLMPTARNLGAAVTSNGRIYVIGGVSPYPGASGCCPHAELEEFNPATTMWRKLSPMKLARFGCAAVATADGRIFVLGGSANAPNVGHVSTNAIEEGTLPTSFP